MFAYAENQKEDVYQSAEAFQRAKERMFNTMDQKVAKIEQTPLFKKFINKLDPAKIGQEPEENARESRFLNDRMRSYFAEQRQYSSPNTIGSMNAQRQVTGEMLEKSEAKHMKRLAASMAPGAFLALGAGLGLTVAPVAGALALGLACVGAVKTTLGMHKDEKEIKEMEKLMRSAHKFQQGEGAESSEVDRLKRSHQNTMQFLKRVGASDQKISETLEKQKTEMTQLMDGTKFKDDNTPSWQKRQQQARPGKPS